MSQGLVISPNPLIALISRKNYSFQFRPNVKNPGIRCCDKGDSKPQVNLSVLRFTLGIPGLDESYLPRYIGYAFGTLLVVNHFMGSDFSSLTPAQLRSETLGLCLSVFSVAVPYIGKFLKGGYGNERKRIPEGVEQIFVMSEGIGDDLKQELAWATYAVLRNTNSISVVISIEDEFCIRGYWNTPTSLSNEEVCGWFKSEIAMKGVEDRVYYDGGSDWQVRKMVPDGIKCILVQRVEGGFMMVASDAYYTDKDESWIAAIANKFTPS